MVYTAMSIAVVNVLAVFVVARVGHRLTGATDESLRRVASRPKRPREPLRT